VELIANTRTSTGLRVKAKIDERKYRKGVEVTKAQMGQLKLRQETFHGEWNYELQPCKVAR
jgi:hypothetical protein